MARTVVVDALPLRQLVLRFRTHDAVSTADEYQEKVEEAWHALHELLSDEKSDFYEGVALLQQMEAEAEQTQDGIYFDLLLGLLGSKGRNVSLSKPKLRQAVQNTLGPGADVVSKRVVPQLVDATHLFRNVEMAVPGQWHTKEVRNEPSDIKQEVRFAPRLQHRCGLRLT
jgi:hypothetical protein